MEDLFGVPMNYIMWVLLALFLPGLGVICVMALRNPVMLKMGLRNIPRRKGQTALIIVGIMISTLIMSASFGTGDTLTYSIRKAVVDGLGTIDEIILSARVDEGGQLGVASYVPIESFYQMQQELAGNDDIDGLAPGVADFAPALNNRTGVSFGRMQIAGVDPVTLQAFGGFRLSDGSPVRVETLEEAQVFLNERGAKELEAQAGDTLTVYVYGESTQLSVKGVVADGGAAGTDPTALLRLDSAQRLFGREAQINSVVVSNRGDELSGAKLSDDVTETLRVMFTDREVAAQLKTSLARDDVLAALAERQERLGLAQSVRDDLAALQVELQSPGLSDQFVSLISDEALREELLETLGGMDDVQLVREVNTLIVDLAEFTVLDIKKDLLEVADQVGSIVTTFFILMGLFSIMVGILLIFLIFVMLAAARRSEMGMARAIGAKRGDLVQMFVFEGASYSVVSGAVGVVLGLIASALIVTVVNRIFAGGGSGADDFQLTRHFEVRSVIVAYCLGMVVTFITVGVSAYRVSRLNIVAAVRDLPTSYRNVQRQHRLPAAGVGPSLGAPLPAAGTQRRSNVRSLSAPVIAPVVAFRMGCRDRPGRLHSRRAPIAVEAFHPRMVGHGHRRPPGLERDNVGLGGFGPNRSVSGHHRHRTDGPAGAAPHRRPPGYRRQDRLHSSGRRGPGLLGGALQHAAVSVRRAERRVRDVLHLRRRHGGRCGVDRDVQRRPAAQGTDRAHWPFRADAARSGDGRCLPHERQVPHRVDAGHVRAGDFHHDRNVHPHRRLWDHRS